MAAEERGPFERVLGEPLPGGVQGEVLWWPRIVGGPAHRREAPEAVKDWRQARVGVGREHEGWRDGDDFYEVAKFEFVTGKVAVRVLVWSGLEPAKAAELIQREFLAAAFAGVQTLDDPECDPLGLEPYSP